MNAWLDSPAGPYELRAHCQEYDVLVAGWVESAQELFMLAPGTPPPLTAEKVRAWTGPQDNPLLFWPAGRPQPVGYAELNPMPEDDSHLWIGHVIVPKALRGLGIGQQMVRHLVRLAFVGHHVSRLSLVVFPDNVAAVRCYVQAGLVSDGVQFKKFKHLGGRFRMLKMTMSRQQYDLRSRD